MADVFAAYVDQWIASSKAKATAVFKQSAQEVFALAQKDKANGGRMPVDTGHLRNTFVSGINGSNDFTGPAAYTVAIAGASLSDSINGGWTAKYAKVQEYGSSKQKGNFFMANAAAKWQGIVTKNMGKLK